MNHCAMVRLSTLINIPKVLESLGHQPKPVLASVGFDIAQFNTPDTKVSYLAAGRLLAKSVEITGCHHFGFLLGQHADPSLLGIAGFLVRSAPNVEAALNSLAKYIGLHDEGGMVILDTDGNTSLFGYTINESDVEAVDQIYDLSIVTACKIMRALCGDKWNPEEVFLTRREPDDLSPYKLFFQAPIRFNFDKSAISFNKSWLKHQAPTADPLLQKHLQKEADKMQRCQNENIVDILQHLLPSCLVNQQCSSSIVAKQLGIHERTLHRRLKAHNTCFRQELEQTRFTISHQLLTETNEPLLDIAISLGYSHTSAFIRAFKKWSGKSPTLWRKEHH